MLAGEQHRVQRRQHAAHDPVTRRGHLSGAAGLRLAPRSRRPRVAHGRFRWLSRRCALRGRSAPSTAGTYRTRKCASTGAWSDSRRRRCSRPVSTSSSRRCGDHGVRRLHGLEAAREDVVDPVRVRRPAQRGAVAQVLEHRAGARPHVEVASEQHRRAAGPVERDLGGPARLPRGLARDVRAQVQVPDAHLQVAVDQSRQGEPPPLAQAPLAAAGSAAPTLPRRSATAAARA